MPEARTKPELQNIRLQIGGYIPYCTQVKGKDKIHRELAVICNSTLTPRSLFLASSKSSHLFFVSSCRHFREFDLLSGCLKLVFLMERVAFYYIDRSVLLENTPLVKFIRNHIRDSSGVFSISSLVRISMLSEISSLSLRLYLNSLMYDRNIFGSSNVFGNLRKMFSNVRATFGQILKNLRKSSESGRKSSENRQLRRH